MAIFPPNVERWRRYILRYVPNPAGGVDFWLAWEGRESGGNLCSYTKLRESGLFQLMPPDNTARGGTTEAALRAACVAGTQTLARQPTDDEIREQMVSFQRYLAYITDQTRRKLAAAGVSWPDSGPSFWSFVKLQHAYPAPSQGWLEQAKASLGRAPKDWQEFRAAVPPTSSLMKSVLDNAEAVGFYGRGGSALVVATIAAGAALMYYLWRRR